MNGTAGIRPTIQLRPATASDDNFILSLAPRFVAFDLPKGRRKRETLHAIRADIRRALHHPRQGEHFFIAEDDQGRRSGFLRLQLQHDFFSGVRACHISDLAVAKGSIGQGVGRALLGHAERWAKARRCKLLSLAVFPGNLLARTLYENNGYATELLRMTKPLTASRPTRTRSRRGRSGQRAR